MRIVHCLQITAHGPLSYADMTSGGRGLTGSEQSMLCLAKMQAAAGHTVVFYVPTTDRGFREGVEFIDINEAWPRLRRADTADVVISWLSADCLRQLGKKPLKIHSLQINDWLLCGFGYEQFVDMYVAVSKSHQQHLCSEQGNPGPDAKWTILPNGVDLARFKGGGERVPRRCVYLSSPDRGLHWLFAIWPEIRFAYPDAELHVFYEVQKWLDGALLLNSEIGVRAHYIVGRSEQLKQHGVVFRGALPPEELAKELMKADVMLYPCDPIRFTEGFSCSTLEACAAGAVPVITDADALGELYGESGAVVIPRGDHRKWTDDFLEATLQLLGDMPDRMIRRNRCQDFAMQYAWPVVVAQWDAMIQHSVEEKR